MIVVVAQTSATIIRLQRRISDGRTLLIACELGITQFCVGMATDDRVFDNHSSI